MKTIAIAAGLVVLCVLVRAQAPPGQPAPPGIRFHHVHLNSVSPSAAADYYVKVFTTSVKTTFNGEVAVRTVNGPLLLFTKVAAPPPT
jgi:hypothetical protein